MSPNELRIGNYVTTISEEQVVDLLCDSINTFHCEGITYDNIFPIQLTEQWLTDFGLDNDSFGYHYINDDMYCVFNKRDQCVQLWVQGDFYGHDNDLFLLKCEYVHEFQNLVYALTKIELTKK